MDLLRFCHSKLSLFWVQNFLPHATLSGHCSFCSLKNYPVLFSSVSAPLLFVVQLPQPAPVGRPLSTVNDTWKVSTCSLTPVHTWSLNLSLSCFVLKACSVRFPCKCGPRPLRAGRLRGCGTAQLTPLQLVSAVGGFV